MKSFNGTVGMFLRKFNSATLQVKWKLFNSLCLSFYGAELWLNSYGCKTILRKLSVAYHIALKKMLFMPKFYSNHYACSFLNTLTCEHFLNLKILRYFYWLNTCEGPCFLKHKIYFSKFSFLSRLINERFFEVYNVRSVLDNDFDALYSRICFVQRNEPSSWSIDYDF